MLRGYCTMLLHTAVGVTDGSNEFQRSFLYVRQRAGSRPHTLLLQPPTPPGNLTCQPLACKMASLESIGSCSLDAYTSASEASEPAGGNDDLASEQTLRSEPLSIVSPSGALTPEYVKRTARLFETPKTSPSKPSPSKPSLVLPPSISLTNGTSSEGLTNGTTFVGKKPSYLGLACSISGYSGITTYDSKLREGFRSRDHSPGRLGLVRSRDTSPLRLEGGPESLPACFKSECGNYLVAPSKTRTVEKSISLSGSPIRVPDTERIQRARVNGVDVDCRSVLKVAPPANGTMDETDRSTAPLANGVLDRVSSTESGKIPSASNSHEAFCEATSHIRESSRSFMSSMLDSAFTSRSDLTTKSSKEAPPDALQSHEAMATAVKSDSKDSLSPPVTVSPQKRSPGAVRVVEFTSQPKSYVRTVVSSRSFFMTSSSVESPFPVHTTPEPTQGSSGTCMASRSISETVVSNGTPNSSNGSNSSNSSMSFIQQRVERLYGPGALAQGFFRQNNKSPQQRDEASKPPDSSTAPVGVRGCRSLPVLRHLRPEFQAQLGLYHPRQLVHSLESEPVSTTTITVPVVLQSQVSVESLPDLQPAAPEVVQPPEQTQAAAVEPTEMTEEKDGHFFLKLLKLEIDRLNGLVDRAEFLLAESVDLPEEAMGKLRSASGQARLLVRQKLQQFEGLCHKNIARSPLEPFPTTSLDLQGFWDMVYLQVDQVHRLFEDIERLNKANWVEDQTVQSDVPDGAVSANPKRRSGSSKRVPAKSSVSEESRRSNEAARKAREEARRKIMEDRRRAMREKKGQVKSVEIFVPFENGN